MNLDNLDVFKQLDPQNMLGEIDGLPDQLELSWSQGQQFALPQFEGITQVVIAGMGGSAIGADLLSAYAEPLCPVPMVVVRDYDLPAWARGAHTLVIASSHSGNTEETLSAFAQATENGCTRIAVCTGGKLAQAAKETDATLWQFEHTGQPRAAVGYSFGLLLAIFARLGLVPDPAAEVADAVQAMRDQQQKIGGSVPTVNNPAKRQALQCINRWVSVMGIGLLAPVARRWKGQVSELAKAWAQFEFLPEANHNTLAGIVNPEELFGHHITIFLNAPSYHPRNQLRTTLTKQSFMLEGLTTDIFTAEGSTRLAQQWTMLHLGDYMSYYLAMLYETDPTPVAAIESFKAEMKK